MDSAALLEVVNDHGFSHYSTAKRMRFLNYALHEILDTEIWPFLLSEESPVTVADQSNLEVTASWKDIVSVSDISNNRLLVPQNRQDLIRNYTGDLTTSGKPLYYYFLNGTNGENEQDIHLYPTPDSIYTIKLLFHLGQADLGVADAESVNLLPPKYHMMIVHKALSSLYAQDDELDSSQFFNKLYNDGMERMRSQMHTDQLDRQQVAVDYFPDAGFLD